MESIKKKSALLFFFLAANSINLTSFVPELNSSSKNLSLDIDNLVITFNTAVTQNGLTSGSTIDFTGAGVSSSQILGAIETSLENKNDGSGSGLLSGSSNQQVLQANSNVSQLLLFTDGGSGSNEDVALVLYNESSSSDLDYGGELTLTNIIKGIDITTLTHDNFWG